jgi:hypothetical protein
VTRLLAPSAIQRPCGRWRSVVGVLECRGSIYFTIENAGRPENVDELVARLG